MAGGQVKGKEQVMMAGGGQVKCWHDAKVNCGHLGEDGILADIPLEPQVRLVVNFPQKQHRVIMGLHLKIYFNLINYIV